MTQKYDPLRREQKTIVPQLDTTETIEETINLQNQLGNRALQRLLAQRSEEGPTDLDDDTASRINQARGGGQALDGGVQAKMGEAMGQDFSEVRVHTSPESDDLNQEVGAKAFTTGQDIFFKEGEYDPHSSGGQELLAHELTHVVQQGSGAVGGSGSGMTVNAPGDTFEQEADAVAKDVVHSGPSETATPTVQREEAPPEEEMQAKRETAVQREEAPPEEEELQAKHEDTVQREGEEEEMIQQQEMGEEEAVE